MYPHFNLCRHGQCDDALLRCAKVHERMDTLIDYIIARRDPALWHKLLSPSYLCSYESLTEALLGSTCDDELKAAIPSLVLGFRVQGRPSRQMEGFLACAWQGVKHHKQEMSKSTCHSSSRHTSCWKEATAGCVT